MQQLTSQLVFVSNAIRILKLLRCGETVVSAYQLKNMPLGPMHFGRLFVSCGLIFLGGIDVN